jgi:hypothetical protein
MRRASPSALALVAAITAFALFDVVPDVSARAAAQIRSSESQIDSNIDSRRDDDFAALATYRPGYEFWRHIFSIPDGSIAFGSAVDGRLLAVFPTRGDWVRDGKWHDATLAGLLKGRRLPRSLDDRRDVVAALIERAAGPVLHNPTRGEFVRPNARRYGAFLREWGAIYERFGVPAEIGLAQALIESGFNPTRRSSARAIGFCQWLERNWRQLDRLSPNVLEAHNQTTQAAYCAAYLTVLAAKYGSFIPALSEHHSGGTNVGRTLVNGARLGGEDIRDRYFLGSAFARDLRRISLYGYRDLYRTYGPRSAAYAEMVFGNTVTVEALIETTPQTRIHAMRTPRALSLAEITRRTRLSTDEVRRFNPALLRRVPAGATLYLPMYLKEFGRRVTFWHGPPSGTFTDVLQDFVRLDGDAEGRDGSFEATLREFETRFRKTNSEEGNVMATVLAYAIDEEYRSRRPAILAEYRASLPVQRLFDRARAIWDAQGGSRIARTTPLDEAEKPEESDD